MEYAIIQTGGKQYRVQPGDSITVEKLDGEEGSSVELDQVLLIAKDSAVSIGQPLVEGARVVAEVAQQGRADKITVFKYKSKTRYHVKNGHRQSVTKLSIKQIVASGEATPTPPKRRRRTADGA
ncbi:MAG: 50S ribosomal protein L21 [Chloroflexi bacterium]|nr:50S ribosomal protein L21 [Chloroflexota bacterium]MQF86107.1 50S ribosomal protein L21 [SAR202 cluster bacterium]|tara:strand:+ start:3167 stop:3538 length:372 start_codon:yes stop_codon:yes gene_type:complete